MQTALLRRSMRFRAIAIRSILGRSIGAALGIGMALSGFGVWSLVVQQLAGALITSVALAAHSPWRPRLKFSLGRLRELWRFGFNVSASQTINGMSEQAMTFLVGVLFGTTALGHFTVAWRVVQLIRALIGSAVYHVGFSAFSRLQQDRAAMAAAVLQATRFACLLGFPIGCGIALLAGPAIVLLFGERWLAAEPMLIVLALEMLPGFYALFFAACFRAAGHANWSLMLSLIYALAGIAAIMLLEPFGLQVVVMAWVARTFLLLPVQVFLLRRLLQTKLRTVLAPLVEPAVASAVMSCAVAALLWSISGRVDNTLLVAAAAAIGAATYAAAIAAAAPDLFKTAIRLPRVIAG